MWRWRLILNDWPCAGAHTLNTTRGCRGRDLVARPVSPEPPANPLLDGEQTGRCSASRAGKTPWLCSRGDVVPALASALVCTEQ